MQIERYNFGEITIDGKTYTTDLIIFPNKIKQNWWRKEGHSLCIQDIKEILDYKPEILIIGTGYSSAMEVPKETIKEIEKLKIQLIIRNTKEATELFNKYIKENKKVVCALHLTC